LSQTGKQTETERPPGVMKQPCWWTETFSLEKKNLLFLFIIICLFTCYSRAAHNCNYYNSCVSA